MQYRPLYPMPPKAEKTVYDLTAKDYIFAAITALCCILLVRLGLFGGFKLGFSVSYCISFLAFTAYFIKKGSLLTPFTVFCGLTAFAAGGVYTVSLNGTVNFFLLLYIAFAASIWFLSLARPKAAKYDLALPVLSLTTTFGTAFGCCEPSLRSLFITGKKNNRGTALTVAGFAAAIPVALIIVPLMVSSDPAFEGLIKAIVGNPTKTVVSIIAAIVVFPFAASYLLGLKYDKIGNYKPPKRRQYIEPRAATAFFATLSFIYLLYILSQLAYFFSAFKGILPQNYDFTAAEYARRGFFEIAAIAAINLILCALVMFLTNAANSKGSLPLRILLAFTCTFTLLLIVTAFCKMCLYIDRFGLTEKRIFVSAMLLFMFCIFVSLVLRFFIRKLPLMKIATVCAAVLLLAMGFDNLNKTVACYNTNAYLNGDLKEIDIETIADAGYSSVPYLTKLSNTDDEKLKDQIFSELYTIMDELYKTEDGLKYKPIAISFSEYTPDGEQAQKLLKKFMKETPDFEVYCSARYTEDRKDDYYDDYNDDTTNYDSYNYDNSYDYTETPDYTENNDM